MSVVLLLESLLSRRLEIVASNDHHVVAAVCRGVVDRLVLAHEDEGDRRGQAAEGTFIGAGVDIVPCARVGETGLRSERLDWGCIGRLRIEVIYLANELRHLVSRRLYTGSGELDRQLGVWVQLMISKYRRDPVPKSEIMNDLSVLCIWPPSPRRSSLVVM